MNKIEEYIDHKILEGILKQRNRVFQELLDENDLMAIFRLDKPRQVRTLRENGLSYIDVQPRKYLLKDVVSFISGLRKNDKGKKLEAISEDDLVPPFMP